MQYLSEGNQIIIQAMYILAQIAVVAVYMIRRSKIKAVCDQFMIMCEVVLVTMMLWTCMHL